MRLTRIRVVLFLRAALLALLGCAHAAAQTLSFPASNTGSIPDNSTEGRTLSFNVGGLTRAVRSVRVEFTATHAFVGDLKVTLRAPLNQRRLLLMGRTGVRPGLSSGTASALSGSYRFRDDANAHWWPQAAASNPVTAGDYRTSTSGSALAAVGGCPSRLDGVFGGLPPAAANGEWRLVFVDADAGATGAVSAATLTLELEGDALFDDGFEEAAQPAPPGTPACRRAFSDFDGNGLSDYVLLRTEAANAVRWLVNFNNGLFAPLSQTSFVLGSSGNTYFELDYDGDGIADAATWQSSPSPTVRIALSSRTPDEPLSLPLGRAGDDLRLAGDYDGDGRDDLAWVRGPGGAAGPYRLTLRSSASGRTRTLELGSAAPGSMFVLGGYDYDDDGLADAAVQETDPAQPDQARFRVLSGRDGAALQTFNLGGPADVLLPGHRVGSPRQDIAVRTTAAGPGQYLLRDMATGLVQSSQAFGQAGDVDVVGDFDGDGLDDAVMWRPSASPNTSRFLIRPSSAPSGSPLELPLGEQGDYPLGNARVR